MRLTRTLAVTIAVCLLVPLMLVSEASARPKCGGKRATKVGTPGDDVIRGTRKDDVIVGLGGDDMILGRGGSDRICGGRGGDVISPGAGRDRISGGAGGDLINFASSRGSIDVDLNTGRASGDGTDSFTSIEHVAGSEQPDRIVGSPDVNILFGEGGDDTIAGGEHIDIFTGDEGNDSIDGGGGFDIMSYSSAVGPVTADLSAGNATGEGTDSLTGIEALQGSSFDDVLRGDAANNFLFGEPGNDRLEGGEGHDAAVYWFSPAPISADLGAGTATGDGDDVLAGIEALLGTVAFGDTLVGDDGSNYLDGDDGNDVISGRGGDDWILPGPGDDTVDGGEGTYDIADFYALNPLSADLSTGSVSGEGADTLVAVEGLGGTDFDDFLTGDGGVNFLIGFGGNDVLDGGGGDDFIDGMAGADTGDGGDGTDNCFSIEIAAGCEDATAFPVHPLLEYSFQAESFRNFRAPRQ